MATVTVSIGRNVGTKPMADTTWADFKSDVIDSIAFAPGSVLHFQGEGIGYGSTTEASYTVVATVRDPEALYLALAPLTTRYRQDSIALTAGTTTFVTEVTA